MCSLMDTMDNTRHSKSSSLKLVTRMKVTRRALVRVEHSRDKYTYKPYVGLRQGLDRV
jgi:hypothetical protein